MGVFSMSMIDDHEDDTRAIKARVQMKRIYNGDHYRHRIAERKNKIRKGRKERQMYKYGM